MTRKFEGYIKLVADDLRHVVFTMLDTEPDFSGQDAAYVAGRVEQEFLAAIRHLGTVDAIEDARGRSGWQNMG